MPVISTNEAVVIGLRSTRSSSDVYGNWTTDTYTHRINFGTTIPPGAVVNSAVIEIYVNGQPKYGSYFTAAGASIRTTVGIKSINASVASGTSYYDLVFSFKATGKEGTQAVLNINNVALTVSYTIPMSAWSVDKTSVSLSGSDSFTVTIVPAASDSLHTIAYAFGTDSRSYDLTAGVTTHTFTVPADWCSQIPRTTSGTGGIFLSTKDASGNVLGTELKYFTATVPENVVPTLTGISFTPIDQKWDVYLQNYSKVTAAITGASGVYGSTITGYYLAGGGYTGNEASLTTGTLNTSGENVFTAYVKDSRGRISATATNSITVTAYTRPALSSVSLVRCLSDGTEDDNGTYLKAVVGYSYTAIGSNAATLVLNYRDGTAEGWTQVYTGSPDSGAILILGSGNFNTANTYQIQVIVSDAIASNSLIRQLDSVDVYLDLQPDRLGVGCFTEASKRFRIADDWEFMIGGKEWTETVDEHVDAKIPEVPVQSVNGQTGDVVLDIPPAPAVTQKDYGGAYFSKDASASVTLSNFTVSESGLYAVQWNIKMVTAMTGRSFAQFYGKRVSFANGAAYPCVLLTAIGQFDAGTTYPLILWAETGGYMQYEDISVATVKLA